MGEKNMKLNSSIIALFLVGGFAASTPSLAQTTSITPMHEAKATDELINDDIRSLESEIQNNNVIEGLKAQAQKSEDHSNDDRILAETNRLNSQGVKPVLRSTSNMIEPVKAPIKAKRNTRTSWISTDRNAGKAVKANGTLN